MWEGLNKRKFPRANYPCKIVVKRKEHPDSLSSHTENLGVGGICVILPKDLGIFAPVEIQLDLLDDKEAIQCDGNIVWIVVKKENGNLRFDTGMEFTNLKEKDADRIKTVVEKILESAI